MSAAARAPGSPDPLGRLAQMPRFLEDAFARMPGPALRVKSGPDDFSLADHACHLRDLEREGYLVRLRRMLEESVPDLPGFDGARVARERDYGAQDPQAALRDFAAARAELLARASSLTAAQWDAPGTFAGRRITVAELFAMADAHDQEHRQQIEALLGDARP